MALYLYSYPAPELSGEVGAFLLKFLTRMRGGRIKTANYLIGQVGFWEHRAISKLDPARRGVHQLPLPLSNPSKGP